MRKRVFGHMRHRRPRSACVSAQSDQDLYCPLIKSLDIAEFMNGEQRPGWYFAHAHDLNLHILHKFEGTFSLDAVYFIPCNIHLSLAVAGCILLLKIITKTCLYNFDPLKPHFYVVKLGFTWVYIISLISAQKHRLWVLVRTASPRRF